MHCLTADPLLLCNLVIGEIIINRQLIDFLLMRCKKLPVEVIQEPLFYDFFHTCAIVTMHPVFVKQKILTFLIFLIMPLAGAAPSEKFAKAISPMGLKEPGPSRGTSS